MSTRMLQSRQISFNTKKGRQASASSSASTSSSPGHSDAGARETLKQLEQAAIGTSNTFQLKKNVEGQSLGLCLAMDSAGHAGRTVIFSVRPSSVASQAGVPSASFLTKVDGISTLGSTLDQVQDMIVTAAKSGVVKIEVAQPAKAAEQSSPPPPSPNHPAALQVRHHVLALLP